MHKTPEMDTYNHIASGAFGLIESQDYSGALNVTLNIVSYLSTLQSNTKMYGDNFGWITAGELLDRAQRKAEWIKAMADMSQNMHIK